MTSKLLGLLSAALLVSSGMASAQAAQSVSPIGADARAGADLQSEGDLRGTGRWIIAAVVLGLVVWGLIELLDDDDQAFPASP